VALKISAPNYQAAQQPADFSLDYGAVVTSAVILLLFGDSALYAGFGKSGAGRFFAVNQF